MTRRVGVNPSVDDLSRAIRDLQRDVDGMKAGNPVIRGDLNMQGFRITNLAKPSEATDAQTRTQVDGQFAPITGRYVIIGPADTTLEAERILTAGSGITLTDNGPNSTVTIATTIAAAPNSASYLTLGLSGDLSAERVLTAGSGVSFTDSGANGTLTISATGTGGTLTSVDVSGGTTGLTTSGGPITTSGTITLAGTLAVTNGGTGATDAATARTNLGLAIGTNVQAYDAGLASLAALPTVADRIAYSTAADTWAETAITAFGRSLIDDADAATARTTLGVGAMGTGAYPGAGIANSTGSAWGTSYTTTGSGTVVALQTSPAFTTPSLGVASGASLSLNSSASAGASLSSITTAISGGTAYGVLGIGQANGASAASVSGIQGQVIARNTLTNAYGIRSVTSSSTGGAITNSYGVYITNATESGGGTTTNKVGLWLESVTGGTSSNWAIQSAGGQSYHVGNLRIGSTTAPTVALDVTGAAKISTSLDVPKLANLTSNGFVKTGSSDGTLSVDTTTYLDTTTAASTYQPLDSDLTSIAALTTTAFGRGLLTETDASTTRTTLGLGALSTAAYPGAGIANSTGSAWGTSYTTTGSGTVVALATSPVFVTPTLGVASGTSLTLSSLTSGRVPYATTSGLLADDAGLTYDATTDALSFGVGILPSGNKLHLGGSTSSGWSLRQSISGLTVRAEGFGDYWAMNGSAIYPVGLAVGAGTLGTSSSPFADAYSTIFRQATNNSGGFYGTPASGSNDYRLFLNSSNNWVWRRNVGGIVGNGTLIAGAGAGNGTAFYPENSGNNSGSAGWDLGYSGTNEQWLSLYLRGTTSGTAQIKPPAAAGTGTVLTLPAATGTLATLAGTETLTNKTYSGDTLTLTGATNVLSSLVPPNNTYNLGASGSAWSSLYVGGTGTISFARGFTNLDGVVTQGSGVPYIIHQSISTTKSANFTAATVAIPAAAHRFRLSAVITTTSSTNTGTLQVTVDYRDSQGVVHTGDVLPAQLVSGTTGGYDADGTVTSAASKEFAFGPKLISTNNAADNIVIKVVITGTVSYTVSPLVEQLS